MMVPATRLACSAAIRGGAAVAGDDVAERSLPADELGNAAVRLDNFRFPFANGGLNVFKFQLDGLPCVGELLAALAVVDFRELLSTRAPLTERDAK